MFMFFVYVLRSVKNRQLYVGFTESLEKRLRSHNAGDVISTKAFRPWTMIFHECYTHKMDALRREGYLKTTQGKRALKHMLREALSQDRGTLPATIPATRD